MHLLKFSPSKLSITARKNRQELIKARLTRRDLMQLGLLTSAGYLIPKVGLSAWASDCEKCDLGCSPPVHRFVDPLPIPPVLPQRALSEFDPAPQECPNHDINPATGLTYEGRGQFNGVVRPGTDCFQFFNNFPVQKYYKTHIAQNNNFRITSDTRIPDQTIWGFNKGGDDLNLDPAITPSPTIVSRYGEPLLVRRFNDLPLESTGFGVPEVSTHLHNFHSAPESDGGPCRFFFRGQYYDYYYTMETAGFDDPATTPEQRAREYLSTLWFHDHRIDHTAENVYKGLAGFHLVFNEFDTGDEGTGFHLPSFPEFDIPVILTDKLLDPQTGEICFDTFGLDGLVGDVFLANGMAQPYLDVKKRRYRFRILDGGPSRFYRIRLTNPDNPSQVIPFWVIANDGNLLRQPIAGHSNGVQISVAERFDIIVDFKKISEMPGAPHTIWLENIMIQEDGRGPEEDTAAPGQARNALIQFNITGNPVADGSVDPATMPTFYELPTRPTPRITRFFRFERGNGQWQVNGRFATCNEIRYTVNRNSAERWILQNNSGGWQHPIHIHLEEFQMVRRNNKLIQAGNIEFSRKDVARLGENEEIELLMRFRDFRGDYPTHCHNTIHEDHAMMLLWGVEDNANDNNQRP